jgi:hypothetical protein
MLFLWLFGSVVEDVLGPLMFLLFYLGGQIGATLLDVGMAESFDPASLRVPRVGASGAIAGILGRNRISVASVLQHESEDPQSVPLVITTHLAREGDLEAAMEEIRGLAVVTGRTVRIRMLATREEAAS